MLNQNMETFKESIKRRTLEDMPNEVLLKIFSYLDTEEILKCAQTSKRMNEICKDKSLWQRQKVSLENHIIDYKIINQFFLLNEKPPIFLNLSNCKGLELWCIQDIVKSCLNLVELNLELTNLSPDSLNFLANNLTSTIRRLSLKKLKNIEDKHIKRLVRRCSKLTVIDLSYCTSITKTSLICIVNNLMHSLEELDLTATSIKISDIQILKEQIPNLSIKF